MIKKILTGCFILLLILLNGCIKDTQTTTGKANFHEKGVSISDQGNYFRVELDFNCGLSHRQIGAAFARGILQMVPDYESLVDSYIAENLNKYEYPYAFFRVDDVKSQLNRDYREEIEGMATVFSGHNRNKWKDNKLSRDELYLFNLFTDVVRGTQCCFVAVYGSRSATQKNIIGRNLDWSGGSKNQLPQIQAVVIIKNAHNKICSLGFLGYQGIITGFNDSKIFAGIIDSQSGSPYDAVGKRSYPLDIRFALENTAKLSDTVNYMLDPAKHYAVNHNIVFGDANESLVLENNFSGMGPTDQRVRRVIRTADSKLNKGVTWGISNAVGCVNSFLVYGNFNNHTSNKYNTKRWENLKKQLLAKGPSVTGNEIKEIIAYKHFRYPGTFSDSGDLYNRMTLQMVLFQPNDFLLEVFFRSRTNRRNPANPIFNKISVF